MKRKTERNENEIEFVLLLKARLYRTYKRPYYNSTTTDAPLNICCVTMTALCPVDANHHQ